MIWKKQMLMLPLLLLVQIQGMNENLVDQDGMKNNHLQGFDMQNINTHHHEVHEMMTAVEKELERAGDGILTLFKEFSDDNEPAKKSKEKCESALEAIKEYQQKNESDGFEYLKYKASYDDITTILSIASTIPDLQRRFYSIKEKWDVTKLFQLDKTDKQKKFWPQVLGTDCRLASLTNDRYIYSHKRYLKKNAKGLEAFKVYWKKDSEELNKDEWIPFHADKKPNNEEEEEEEREDEEEEEEREDEEENEEDSKIKMEIVYKPTKNGDEDVYYDPVMAANDLQHNFYWILKTWSAFYFGAGIMKQYLDPKDMAYSFMNLLTFGNGRLFFVMTMMMIFDSLKYLNIVMTNDGSKLIIPKKESAKPIYKAMNFFLESYHDLFVTCFVVAGTIAEFTVITNPLNNFEIEKRKEETLTISKCEECIRKLNSSKCEKFIGWLKTVKWKKFFGSVLVTTAIFGLIFFMATFAFAIAFANHNGGQFAAFNKECYNRFPDHGYTDLMCYETLAADAVTFWLPGMTEGWTEPWMPISTVVGGLVWFLPGLLLKIFKIEFIEPELLASTLFTSWFFHWAYRKLRRKRAIQDENDIEDNLDLRYYHNFTKSTLQFIGAGLLWLCLKVLLIMIFSWKKLYFSFFFVLALGGQAAYYIIDLLPQNKFTKHIAPGVAIGSWILDILSFIMFLVEAGTPGGEGVTPYQTGIDFLTSLVSTIAIITVLGVSVKGVLMWRKWLWYKEKNQNKMAFEYMHDFSHAALEALSLDKDTLWPKKALGGFILSPFVLYFFGYLWLRSNWHHHVGEF